MKLKCIEVAHDVGFLTVGKEYPAQLKGRDDLVVIVDDDGDAIGVRHQKSALGKFEVIP